jgi:hypothetical protein
MRAPRSSSGTAMITIGIARATEMKRSSARFQPRPARIAVALPKVPVATFWPKVNRLIPLCHIPVIEAPGIHLVRVTT